MNHTEDSWISSHLLAERNRWLGAIAAVRSSGTVAAEHCWLVESTETKGDRSYTYARLVRRDPGQKLKSKRLGKPGSEPHRYWQGAIARRTAIAELEQQLTMVEAVLERQKLSGRKSGSEG
jgi:hypothetical protein